VVWPSKVVYLKETTQGAGGKTYYSYSTTKEK
jgi:hypothetical protein